MPEAQEPDTIRGRFDLTWEEACACVPESNRALYEESYAQAAAEYTNTIRNLEGWYNPLTSGWPSRPPCNCTSNAAACRLEDTLDRAVFNLKRMESALSKTIQALDLTEDPMGLTQDVQDRLNLVRSMQAVLYKIKLHHLDASNIKAEPSK